jgi:hypothetical protein
MNKIKGVSNSHLEDGDQTNLESKATKVELGDNFVIIFDELEHGDLFYVILCNKLLHRCEQTIEDEWGNIWYEGEMILQGVWYYRMPTQQCINISYKLLRDSGVAYTYSHLVVASKFPMLSFATKVIKCFVCLLELGRVW